jgi:hypothetical protein
VKQRPNVVITLLSACLVLPMAALSIAKELHRTLVQIKKNEYPVCNRCKHWNDRYEYCRREMEMGPTGTTVWRANEYCSKWEEN